MHTKETGAGIPGSFLSKKASRSFPGEKGNAELARAQQRLIAKLWAHVKNRARI